MNHPTKLVRVRPSVLRKIAKSAKRHKPQLTNGQMIEVAWRNYEQWQLTNSQNNVGETK